MLTTYQEILIDMIGLIKDEEAKAKFIKKIMEKNNKNYLPLQNTYKFKDVMKQFEIQKSVTIQDLKFKSLHSKYRFKTSNIENQRVSLNNQTTKELDSFVNSMTIYSRKTKMVYKNYFENIS